MIPKFRAWDRLTGKMFPVGIIDYSIQSIYIEEPNGMYSEKDFDRIELMQSTGLADENGKEIFEGDIVLIYGEKISKVFYSQGSFCVDILNGGTPLHAFSSKQLEVIGNIWENKELLEENKMSFMEDHPEWYGTYSDYHPEITRYKTNQELEEEIEQLKAEIDELNKSIADLKHIVISISW